MKVIDKKILRQLEANIDEIKKEVKILKELQSDYILRYYEDYENEQFYLIFTEKCVIKLNLNILNIFQL